MRTHKVYYIYWRKRKNVPWGSRQHNSLLLEYWLLSLRVPVHCSLCFYQKYATRIYLCVTAVSKSQEFWLKVSWLSLFLSTTTPTPLRRRVVIFSTTTQRIRLRRRVDVFSTTSDTTSCRWCFLNWVQLHQKTGKNWSTNEPRYAKVLSLMRYNLFMGVNEMHVKILLLLCRLGLVLRLGSV